MKKRATIYLDGDLWKDFRSACIQRGFSASHLVNILIHEQMSAWMGDVMDQEAKGAAQPKTEKAS